MAKSKAVAAKRLPTPAAAAPVLNTKLSPISCIVAFIIPVALTLIAYAAFGVYPFGEGSVLALDLNGQYVYYFEALRDAFWGDGSIFYSWGRDLSGEFMGIIGYYLASPFTLIVMLLPRTMILESLLIMQLCKLGTAGVTFCIYAQKSKHVKPVQAVLFSTMYAMMGYAVIQLIDPMWIDGVVFLPLIVLGIEYLIDDGRKLNYIIPLAIMFVANFYIGFMTAIFVAIYFFFYLFFGTTRKFKKSGDYVKVIVRMGISTIVVLMCSAIMILPVYNALSLGKFDFSKPDYSFQTQFSPIELVPTLFPNQYYSVNMHGKPEIYCGVLTVCLLPLFFLNKKISRNNKIGYGLLAFVLLFSMYIKPIDMLWHGGQTPNWLPYRYSFLLSFVLVSIAATIFSNLDGYKLSLKAVGGTFGGIAVLVFIFNTMAESFEYIQTKFKYVQFWPYIEKTGTRDGVEKELWLGTLGFGLFLAAFYLVMLYFYSNTKKVKTRNIISIAMAVVISFEVCYNAYDSFKKIDKEVAYSDRDTYYNEIQAGRDVTDAIEEYNSKNGGSPIYRSEKTFFRCVNDNLAYGLKGVSHSSSVMNTRAINFLETMGYEMQSFTTRYDGTTPLADSILGIKYIVHDNTKHNSELLLNPGYNEIFSQAYINNQENDAMFHVYENPDALGIGYMISDEITNLGTLGNDNPFNSQNIFFSTMTGNTDFTVTPDVITIDGFKEYYTRLPETIVPINCTAEGYGDSVKYVYNGSVNDNTDSTVNLHITAQSTKNIYMYLRTPYKESVNLWISTTKDENGNFINHNSMKPGNYFNGGEYGVVRVGSFEPGTEIEVRLTLVDHDKNGEKFTIIKSCNFYELDEEAMRADINKLKENQWNITKFEDNYIEGTITAQEGQLMFTSIPYEKGWTIEVDGKKVDYLVEEVENENGSITLRNLPGETGVVAVVGSLIGIRMPAGEHTVTMKYTPPGFTIGVILLLLGIASLVVLFLYDRKNNPVILARAEAKKRIAIGLPPVEEPANNGKKNVAIIKSHSAQEYLEKQKSKAAESAPAAENKPETAKPETAKAQQSKQNNNSSNGAKKGKNKKGKKK